MPSSWMYISLLAVSVFLGSDELVKLEMYHSVFGLNTFVITISADSFRACRMIHGINQMLYEGPVYNLGARNS